MKNNIELLTVEEADIAERYKMKLIGNIVDLNMFFQQLPVAANIMQNEMAQGCYKLVFPKGIMGQLMKYKNGFLSTNIVGIDNKIVAHAGLIPAKVLNLTPLMIFSMMSLITGQFFLYKINQKLTVISQDVKEVVELIYDEKKADTSAVHYFFEHIQENLYTILFNEELRKSILTNILDNNNKLYSHVKFYSAVMKRNNECLKEVLDNNRSTAKRMEDLKERIDKFNENINQQHLCFSLLCIGRVREIQIGQIYEEKYHNNVLKELTTISESIALNVKSTFEYVDDTLLHILKDTNGRKGNEVIEEIKENERIYLEKQKIFEEHTNYILEGIQDFTNKLMTEQVFLINDGNVYVA